MDTFILCRIKTIYSWFYIAEECFCDFSSPKPEVSKGDGGGGGGVKEERELI